MAHCYTVNINSLKAQVSSYREFGVIGEIRTNQTVEDTVDRYVGTVIVETIPNVWYEVRRTLNELWKPGNS